MNHFYLRIFDVDVCLQTDSVELLKTFLALYHQFVQTKPSPTIITQLNYDIKSLSDVPHMLFNGKYQLLPATKWLARYLTTHIRKAVYESVESHLLLHAGAVAREENGVLVAGNSFYGKTTLVLRLANEGFQLLGDDVAAINLGNGKLDPFLRRAHVRPGTRRLAKLELDEALGPNDDQWIALDLSVALPSKLGRSATLRYAFILCDSAAEVRTNQISVIVDRLPDKLLMAVDSVVDVVSVTQTAECVLLRIREENLIDVHTQLTALCDEHGVFLLNIEVGPMHRPNFQSPAYLEPLDNSEAALELLRFLRAGHQSKLFNERFGGSASRMYFELWQRLANAQCFRLQVGPLEDMVSHILSVVES